MELLIFAPCLKVVVDKEDNSLSLISILQEVQVGFPSGAPEPIPAGTSAPLGWYAFALWRREENEAGKRFEQRVVLRSSAGETLADATTEFQGDKLQHRVSLRFVGFPVWAEGACSLHLYLREVGQAEWEEFPAFPLEIKHVLSETKTTP